MGCGSCAQKNIENSQEKSKNSKSPEKGDQLNAKASGNQNQDHKKNTQENREKNQVIKADLTTEENTQYISIEHNQSQVKQSQKEENQQAKNQGSNKENSSQQQIKQPEAKAKEQVSQSQSQSKELEQKGSIEKKQVQSKEEGSRESEIKKTNLTKTPRQGEDKQAVKYLQDVYSKNIRRVSQDNSQISTRQDNAMSIQDAEENWNPKEKSKTEAKSYLGSLYNKTKPV